MGIKGLGVSGCEMVNSRTYPRQFDKLGQAFDSGS